MKMSNRENYIERNVGKFDGSRFGNVFLIDRQRAITVKHCIDNVVEPIKLIFPKLDEDVREVKATVISGTEQEDGWVILQLAEELPAKEITFASMDMPRYSEAEVYGHNINHIEGRWIRLRSGAGEIPNPDIRSDLLFDAVEDKEKDFSGLSGSPIIKDGRVIGIVSQEILENRNAVSIHGISVKSSTEFFAQNNIEIEYVANEEVYTVVESSMSIGTYRDKSTSISVAGNEDLLSYLKGMYIDKLNEIVQRHRNGDVDGAWIELKSQITKMEGDSTVSDEIKAEYYYKIAIWYLEDRGEVGKGQKRYDKAKSLNPDLDGSIFMALKLSKTGEDKNAEELLEPIDSAKKFNIYLQICVNSMKVQKAYEKYEEVSDTIVFDSNTYYMLATLELLRRNYDKATELVNKAIEMDRKIPFFYLLKGIIAYWKAMPNDVCLPDDLFPVMFANGLFQLEVAQLELIRSAINDYRKAYQLAENAENKNQTEFILSAWVNTLSVDYSFQSDIMEPLHLLKESNPYNVTLLLFMMQRNMKLDDELTIDNLEIHASKSANKVGELVVLLELCLSKDDKKTAKRLLHEYKSLFLKGDFYEYWYEYAARAEEDKDRRNEYEEEITKSNELDEVRKNRLQNMFIQMDGDRDEELEKKLIALYEQTGNRLDLVNLIHFYRTRRIWGGLLQYAEVLAHKFGDVYGEMYKIQGLIGQEEYETAISVIEELKKKDIAGFDKELSMNQMQIYERLGDYTAATEVGEALLRKKPSEQIILNLASLYALDGDEDAALRTLVASENNNLLTVGICQRISNYYLTRDNKKAWEYAKKAMQLSGEEPDVVLWAAGIGNRVGKSRNAGELYHKVMINPNHESVRVMNIDELLELIRESRKEADKRTTMLYEGEMASHLFVDATKGNMTYAEYFYRQWENNDMAPMEFGAHHYYAERLKENISGIALDYSSCLLMNELGVLNILCDTIEHVYIVGDLFGVLSEEVRTIPIDQEDLVNAKIKLIEKCKNDLKLEFVEVEVLENADRLGIKQTSNAMSAHTANVNDAMWVSHDEDGEVKEYEIVAALFRCNKISRETYLAYQINEDDVRESVVQKLVNEHPRLLVDEVVLEKWDTNNLLSAVTSSFKVLVEGNAELSAIESKAQMEQKERIQKRVLSLRENLSLLKDGGKIRFLPVLEQKRDMKYTRMLETLLLASEKRNIPICVDDRMLTSYSSVGKQQIYNTFDLMKYLYLLGKISIEKYAEIWKMAIDKNIRYMLPDNQVIMYAFNLSEINDREYNISESKLLKDIRRYVLKALSDGTYLSQNSKAHVQIPEREYFVFNLQRNSRELIRLIWQSDMELIKKRVVSDWVLCHYSQFAFDFSTNTDANARKLSQAIQIADFFIAGILLSRGEERIAEYYNWLYEWIGVYLEKNTDIKDKALNYAKEFLASYLLEGKRTLTREEYSVLEIVYATGIYHMPEEFKNYVLKDNTLSELYNSIYCGISIVLTQQRQIPVPLYKMWINDVLALNEGQELIKTFETITFQLSWFGIMPGFPGVIVKWREKGQNFEKRMFLELGERLRHERKEVRKLEYNAILPYLNEEYDRYYMQLLGNNRYVEASDEILKSLQLSIGYELRRIKQGLVDYWFGKKNTWHLMIPPSADFFKQLYNADSDAVIVDGISGCQLPLQFGIKKDEMIENHNPIRLLHRLAGQLSSETDSQVVLATISKLFSFYDEINKTHGEIYILFLKCIWKVFNELETYKDENQNNLILWSYIWADMMMTGLVQVEAESAIDVKDYVKQLQKDMQIELETDGIGDEINEEVLSPESMNLFRICVNGTLAVCCKYKEKIQPVVKNILEILRDKFKEWMSLPVHFVEKELMHTNMKGSFETIFAENTYMLMRTLGEVANSQEIMDSLVHFGCIPNRRQVLLLSLLKMESLSINEIMFLFFISRETMSEDDRTLVEVIIEEKIIEKENLLDSRSYRFLSAIIEQLSDEFTNEYKRKELARIGEKLRDGDLEWTAAEERVVEIVDATTVDEYLSFWEEYADSLDSEDALQMAERIGWMQPRVSFEESERVRELRIRLELRD